MKQINYTGSSKLISRIVSLLNRKAPLPLDGNGDPDWGTAGQVLTTDGSGATSWGAGGGGGDTVSWTQTQLSGDKIAEIDINGTTTDVYAPSQTPQAQADWTEADNTAVDYIKNKPNLATVATSGDYSDLLNKPTIPSVGGHTIEKADGTDMTARALLQFIGAYLSDDAGNDRTIANIVRTMTQAQFNNLSAAEKEGLIYISDAAGQLTASEVALAAIAGMSATTVQSGISELKSDATSLASTVSGKVSKSGDDVSGKLSLYPQATPCIKFRSASPTWCSFLTAYNGGNEALLFATKNAATSFMVVNGEDSEATTDVNRWMSLVPGLQVKNNCVAIGKLIGNGVTPTYKLDVGGSANFLSAHKDGVDIPSVEVISQLELNATTSWQTYSGTSPSAKNITAAFCNANNAVTHNFMYYVRHSGNSYDLKYKCADGNYTLYCEVVLFH